MFHLNVNSLRNKAGEIESFLKCSDNFDVLCFSEHFLNENEVDFYKLDGFYAASNFVRKNHIHGGTIIFCRNNLASKPINYLESLSVEMQCEISAVEINKLNCMIITIYRPPSGDFNVFMDTIAALLESTNSSKKHIIINGDFNIHFDAENTRKNVFLDLIHTCGFSQQIFENTRNQYRIDNIFINFCDTLEFKTSVFNPHLSDHCAINIYVFFTDNLICDFVQKEIRPFTRAGQNKFFARLGEESWDFIKENINVNINFNMFMEKLIESANAAFPLVKRKFKNNTKINWFSKELQSMRVHLNFLVELNTNFRSDELINEIKCFRKIYRAEIAKAKKRANSAYVERSNNTAKAVWDVINSNRKTSNRIDDNNDLKAEHFNNYFVNIADNIRKTNNAANMPAEEYLLRVKKDVNVNFSFREVSFMEVRDAINNLKSKSSRDIYDLNITLIKKVKEMIIIPLTKLINMCIKKGIYPDCLKLTKVIPVFKKGSKDELNNYRPISLIPVISKIIEYLLRKQLYEFFESNKIFIENQYGFRSGRSTVAASINLIESIIDGFEKGEVIGTTFCDLTKAFDCVEHTILIQKLKLYGIGEMSLELIKGYLTNRYQKTFYGGEYSESKEITCGVPQGSLLGPLLFLIYVNDISVATSDSELILFADDTTILNKNKNQTDLETSVERGITELADWYAANHLSLNLTKTEKMFFSLRNDQIQNPQSVRFLGVTFDNQLKFDAHVDSVSKKISKNIYLLKNLKYNTEQRVCMIAYHALIQSLCTYCLLIWGHSTHASRIFALQRKAIRVLAGLDYRADVRQSFIDMGILTIPSQYIFECLLYARKNWDRYGRREDIHDHNTRNKESLNIGYLRLKKSENSTLYYVPTFFNKLPEEVRTLDFNKYKTVVKDYLLKNPFYNIDDFINQKIIIGAQ